MRKDRITQKDIAKLLNISQATVARVVNNSGKINEETRDKVLKKINELDYKPNKIASNLVRQGNRKVTINVIIPTVPATFWNKMQDGIIAGLNEIIDYGIIYKITNIETYEMDKLVKYLVEMKEQRPDYLILFPLDNEMIVSELNQLAKEGTKIIFINDDIKSIPKLFYIGPDNLQGGRLAGEFMGKFLRGKGNIFVIACDKFSVEIQERHYGFNEVIKQDYDDIKVNYFIYDRGKQNAYDITIDILSKYNDIDGIYDSDGNIDQVSRALFSVKRNDIILIGHEYHPGLHDLIQQKYIYNAINQDAFKQGYNCIKILSKYLFEGKPLNGESFYTDFNIVMKYNSDNRNSEVY